MASRMAAVEATGRSDRQASGADRDASARHPGAGQAAFSRCDHRQQHALPIAPNLLSRNFTVAWANTVWAGDTTYIPTREGWLYLAVALDLFSRRIVGWAMGEAITAELACRALDMAWHCRPPAPGLIFQSDRGSQYASAAFTARLKEYGMRASMSRKETAGTSPARRRCSDP
ncbi:transposase InsO family protein [Granulicella aggregans]|uniref:Transposase InsO family protein n=1 Tax=Granulicella aggregans TaxID=474949 RepID=A0A7W7ZI94_9BACT|nr:transposase InsO family protein [Granulicella aggregans]